MVVAAATGRRPQWGAHLSNVLYFEHRVCTSLQEEVNRLKAHAAGKVALFVLVGLLFFGGTQ